MNSPSCSPLLPPSPGHSCSPLPTMASLPLSAPPVSAVGPCVSAGPSRSTCQTSRSQLVTTVPLAEGMSVCTPAPSLPAGLQQGPAGAIAVLSPGIAPEHSQQRRVVFGVTGRLGTVSAQPQLCAWKPRQPSPAPLCLRLATGELVHGRPGPFSSGTGDSVPWPRPSSGHRGSAGESTRSSGSG